MVQGHILYSFCTEISAVNYHCIIHIYYLEKIWKTQKNILSSCFISLVLCLLFSFATTIAGCLSNVTITSHMSPFWTFCARAPSGFENVWNIQRVSVQRSVTFTSFWIWIKRIQNNVPIFSLVIRSRFTHIGPWKNTNLTHLTKKRCRGSV